MKNCLRNYWVMITPACRKFRIISIILLAAGTAFSMIPKPVGSMTSVILLLDMIPVLLTDMFSFVGIWDTRFSKTLLIKTSPTGEDFVQKAVIGDVVVRAARKLLLVLVAVAALIVSVNGELNRIPAVTVLTIVALGIGFWGVDGIIILLQRGKTVYMMNRKGSISSTVCEMLVYAIGYLSAFLTSVINLASDDPSLMVVVVIMAASVVVGAISVVLLCTRTKKTFNKYIEEA